MSTAEEKHKTGKDNEGKTSEGIENGNDIMTKEVSNQELDKIMENISSEDKIPNLVDEMEEIAKDNPNETLSPYNRSESQDEDLLLRWDDEDIDDDQEKNDEIMHQEIEVLGDEITGNGKLESCLISQTDHINTNDIVSNRANDTEADAILKDVKKNANDATNLLMEDDDDDHNANLTTDDKNNDDTSKIDNEDSDIIISGDGIVNLSSSNAAIVQISIEDDIVVCSTQDIHNRNSSISEANISDASCIIIDQNIITEDISEKYHKALKTDDYATSSVPSEEIVQENTPSFPKAEETNYSNIIDENKIIKDINDKIAKALSEVIKPQERGDQDTEPEEKSCDENIIFLEQQLKVLAKSINSNLDKHTDIIHTNLRAVSKPTSEVELAVTGTVPNNEICTTVEVSNLEMDVDEITQTNPQDHKSQSPNGSEIVPNVDSRIDKVNVGRCGDSKIKIDNNIDKNQNSNTSEMVQSIDSSIVQQSIEKDIGPKMDGGIKILNVDQINKNINAHKPENVQNIDTHKESDTLVEIDADCNFDDCENDKNQNANESEIVNIDSSTRKENNVTNDTGTDVNLRPKDNTKQRKSQVEKVSDSNKPEKKINESDEDDDVVEIIERCDNYIDLSSQSPINLDNEVDPEMLKDNLGPTEDVALGNRDKTKSKSDSYNVNTDHRLRPDVMLEIPMHNLIDVEDIDESINIDSEETSQDSVTKVTAVKSTEVKVSTDIKEEKISTLEKDIDNLDLTHEKSEKKLKEIRNEIANLNMKIQNEPTCRLGKQITENDSNLIKTELNNSNQPKTKSIDPNIKEENIRESALKKEKDISLESAFATRMTPDTADEAPEVSDSLGLLAESSRVRREDDEIEEDEDDDDDYDQDDESSNQMTAEHSEDSNAQQSEPDSKDQEDKTGDKERAFNFKESDNRDVGGEVVEAVASEGVDSVEKGSNDESSESTSVEKNEIQSKKDGEVALPSTDIDMVKSSDNSDNEIEAVSGKEALKSMPSTHKKTEEKSTEKIVQSPSKAKKLEISMPRLVLNIVDLEESSSEEDTPEMLPIDQDPEPEKLDDVDADVTSVNIPTEIEIMSTSCGNTSQIVTKEGEVVIQGVPKPPPHKLARLNTSEVTIKTAHASSESTLIIPETKMSESTEPQVGLEVFNLDSDDDDLGGSGKGTGGRQKLTALELDAALRSGRCLRRGCTAGARGSAAGPLGHYCEDCANAHYLRTQSLVEGIKNMTPLLELNMEKLSQDLVEISDSDSENEVQEPKETIGDAGAALLEENLARMINSMWHKYKMDASLTDAKELLDAEMERLDNESKDINKMLNDCQAATDKLRNELYATFEPKRQELPAVVIYDNPNGVIISLEADSNPDQDEVRHGKRRLSAAAVQPAKRPAIPLGYTPLDPGMVLVQNEQDQSSMLMAGEYSNRYEDDKDVSVVQLSAEAAPADLPPPGEPKRPPLKIGMQVLAMRNAFGSWSKARIIESMKLTGLTAQFPSFRVKFDHKVKNPCKVLSARCLAFLDPADVRLTIGTRVIALFKESSNQAKTESYYSGIIAEIPNPVNNYRYLVFFDDGYAQYASHAHTRIVCASAAPVWEEVHPFSREFVRNYLCAYPERPMVRLHAGQRLNTEWNGKWWDSRVIQVDASLVQVHFEEDNRTEWIYRGSTRLEPLFLELQAAVRHRGRHLPRSKAQLRTNMPYVEYTRSYEQDRSTEYAQQEELRRQRSVAKKSTANTLSITSAGEVPDAFASRVVYYTPRNAVRPYKMVSHTCGPKCKRSDVLTLKELRSYNPLAKPLLSGWERQLVRNKGTQAVLYRAPCGRRLRSARELQRYLRLTRSDTPIDLFDFNPETHCLAEFVLSKCIVGKKDLSHGKENVPVPCVNSVDESLPEFCSYNTERTPTAGVPLNLDPEFLCGCDCTDDCEDKTKCTCWQLTLEGAKTIGIEGTNVGYEHKRLPEPLPSGIYECNVRCKCQATCLNRVAQHPLQLKLQVFKTPNRGWGIRALNDVPKGAFLCVYAGNLLTDATANLDGLNEGDEYLAELDYIEVVEQMKEGYEEDVPEADKILDKKESEKKEEKSSTEAESSSEDEEMVSKDEEQDDDFRPGYIGLGLMEFNKRLRRRGKKKDQEEDQKAADLAKREEKEQNADEDCITISDDEEVREPSRFTAQAGMGASEYVPKYRSVRAHFGRDEACYIMDAKVQGNIGRYLNHSCSPNVFVQNVFVDTHDPRFPWVAFFALSHIRAGTELTWNYNYDVGSVPGKVLYCYCGALNCRRRLL